MIISYVVVIMSAVVEFCLVTDWFWYCRLVAIIALYLVKDVAVYASTQNKRSCSVKKRCGSWTRKEIAPCHHEKMPIIQRKDGICIIHNMRAFCTKIRDKLYLSTSDKWSL